MDPLALVGAAVALLVPFFKQTAEAARDEASQALGAGAVAAVRGLYERIKQRFADDALAETSLEGMRNDPDSERDQGAVQMALARAVQEDEEFGREIAELIEEAKRRGGAPVAHILDVGAVAFGNMDVRGVNVSMRDMTIQGGQHVGRGALDDQ